MCDHIINIHPNELLHTKTKDSRIDEHKKFIKKMDNLLFLPIILLQDFLKS